MKERLKIEVFELWCEINTVFWNVSWMQWLNFEFIVKKLVLTNAYQSCTFFRRRASASTEHLRHAMTEMKRNTAKSVLDISVIWKCMRASTPKNIRLSAKFVWNVLHEVTSLRFTCAYIQKSNHISVKCVRSALHINTTWSRISVRTPENVLSSVTCVWSVFHVKFTWKFTCAYIQTRSHTNVTCARCDFHKNSP